MMELLVSLVVLMTERTSVKVDNSCDSVHVVNGSCEGNLSTETVTSKSGHCQLLLVHKSSNIVRDLFHSKTFVVIRVSHVSIVEQPNVSGVQDLVVWVGEEWSEVFNWLDKVTEPDHSREIWLSSLEESSSEFDMFRLGLHSSL